MQIHQLGQVNAFVVIDLEGAERAAGTVRLAPKILRDGAVLLARSATYQFASFGWQVSGASAGISAPADGRDAAVAQFVAELATDTGPSVLLEPGKGVTDEDLAPLRAIDPRPAAFWLGRHRLTGLSAMAATHAALGGLDGRTIAVESLDAATAAFVAEASAEGARIVAIGAGAGAVTSSDGFDPGEVAAAAEAHGPAGARQLGPVTEGAWITSVEADVLAVSSKAGVVDHRVAAGLGASLLVPLGPVPVTARGLAVARRGGCTVLPDFLTTAGPAFAMWADADATIEVLAPTIVEHVTEAVRTAGEHPDGPLLGACERAEAFLTTWRDELPFGRPLA